MAASAEGTIDERYLRFVQSRLSGMKTNRYSWWTHWRELADFFLPRRYKWLITPNQQARGSPINQHIIDSTGCIAARNLAAGLLSGKTPPHRQWFHLRAGRLDSTKTSPVSLWLAECERLMALVFQASNFYPAIAQFYYDLVIFGTAVLLIYEDFDNVAKFYNPCAGEYYVDLDGAYRPCILYREFTMTIGAVVDEFGYDNCSFSVRAAYDQAGGSGLTHEIIVAHAIEPNDDDRDFGIPKSFAYREAYWEMSAANAPQGGALNTQGFLRKKGFHERIAAIGRWDIVSNDPYGRCPAMDGLGDQKQLQVETKRKGQGIDKMVNPPLVADIQLKNSPASLLPGGMTYVSGYTQSGKPGISSIYDTKFPVNEIREDIAEVQERLRKVFFNDLFQTASQFETRSNITAVEWDMRKSESMIMLGPVIERLDNEVLTVIVDRVWGIMTRAGIIPPPPPEIANMDLDIEFVSMMAQAQDAASAASIERILGMAGNISGVNPGIMDRVDTDYALEKYGKQLSIDPKVIRSDAQVNAIRKDRAMQEQAAQQAAMAEQLAAGAKTLSETEVGAGQNALELMTGA